MALPKKVCAYYGRLVLSRSVIIVCNRNARPLPRFPAPFIVMSNVEAIRIHDDNSSSAQDKVLCSMYVYPNYFASRTQFSNVTGFDSCHRQFSRYTCPECNVSYCSLMCFRSEVGTPPTSNDKAVKLYRHIPNVRRRSIERKYRPAPMRSRKHLRRGKRC